MSNLKLEAGKYYRTRDGSKAFISAVESIWAELADWKAQAIANKAALEWACVERQKLVDANARLRTNRNDWKAQALDATAECNALAAKVKELEQELSCEEALVLMWSSRAESLAAKLQAFEDQKIRDSNYAQGVVKERDALAAKVAQWEQAFEQERAEKKELGMERNELQHKVARVEAALGKLEEWKPIYVGRIRNALNPPAAPEKCQECGK